MNNPTMQPGDGGGAVYFMTNTTDGKNEIVMAQRAADGSLRLVGAFATGSIRFAWWWVIPPGAALMLFLVACYFVGRAFEERLNPRLRERR